MLVSLLDAIGDLSIWPLVAVGCNYPIDWVSLHGSLFLGPLPLRELDLIDLFQEQWPVVILIKDLDDDADSGGFRRNTLVSNGDLRKIGRKKVFRQRNVSTRLLIFTDAASFKSHPLTLISSIHKASLFSFIVVALEVDTMDNVEKYD